MKLTRQAVLKVPTKVFQKQDQLTEVELAKIIRSLPGRWSLLAEVLSFGTLRLGEELGLRVMNVTPRGLTLTHASRRPRNISPPTTIDSALSPIASPRRTTQL